MQFLATSTRPSFGFGVAAMGSLPPESLATVLFGNVFGSLRWTTIIGGPTGTASPRAPGPIGRRTTSSPAPCPPCCFCGTASRADGFAREFRFFLIVGTLAVLYALGRYTPGFEMIFDHLPGVNLYRRPADATFLINVALAVASGYLVHRYVKDGNPRLIRSLRRPTEIALPLIAAALFVAAIASALVFASRAGQMTASVREIALGVLAAAAAVAIVMRLGPRWRLTAAAGLVAATGAELIARHAASALNAEPAERYAVFQQLPPEQLQGLQVLKTELAARNARGERPRIEILGLGGAWAERLDGPRVGGHDRLQSASYRGLRARGRPGRECRGPEPAHLSGDLSGLQVPPGEPARSGIPRARSAARTLAPALPRLSGVKLLYGSGQMWIYRLDEATPRVYVASQIEAVASDVILDQEELPDFERSNEALVDEGSIGLLKRDYRGATEDSGPPENRSSARIVSYQRNSVAIEVETERPGVLVLHDIYYPGWEVTVDGERRPVLRTNLLFRGVEVEAGRHRVEFEFRPLSLDNLGCGGVESREQRRCRGGCLALHDPLTGHRDACDRLLSSTALP